MRKSFKDYDGFVAVQQLAKQAAVEALGLHWKLVRGASVQAHLPAPWTACKVFGRVSKSPRDIRLPAPRFWPGGTLPIGPEYYEEYAWETSPIEPLPAVNDNRSDRERARDALAEAAD